MSLFNLPVKHKEKDIPRHPWSKTIKDIHSHKIKTAHNTINNPVYPDLSIKERKRYDKVRTKFVVIGNRTAKEFIYCVKMVQGMHRFRTRSFEAPVIRGVTSIEWPSVWRDLKIKYGTLAHCIRSQVAVICNDTFLGGEKDLKDLIESKYIYHLCIDYLNESINQFVSYVNSSGRPCAYFHFSVADKHIGTMIFMLYSDIVPNTCENFLRLCKTKRGGYGGTPVHRIVKDGWIQCGGFGLKNTDLACENFIVPFDRRGVLAMANDGRHRDCSTQFFVLLQPAPWMEQKYVAFGQLIEGKATLEAIENVQTWYESPTSTIVITDCGQLNLDCRDIMINRGTNEYIQGHIEDLVTLGEFFIEMLLEKVFLEIEYKHLQDLQGEGEEEQNKKDTNIHTTERFIREKSEIETHDKNDTPTTASKSEDNNDFDVDGYEYEPEEFTYSQVSAPTPPPKEKKPFYIPLTDVPYPGEVDSTYDLKKLLKGDYCIECDLEEDKKKKPMVLKEKRESYMSDVVDFFNEMQYDNLDDDEVELDSDDQRELQEYIQKNVDRVSFAGGVVKGIAAKKGMVNLFANSRKSELITDEELRKIRLASVDLKRRESRKVSIISPDWDQKFHKKIKRRQTGFVTKEDLEQIRIIQKKSGVEISDEDEDGEERVGKVRITADEESHDQIKRRPTTFVRPGAFDFDEVEDDEDVDEGSRVHIAPDTEETHELHFKRRPTTFVRPGTMPIDEDDEDDDGEETKPKVRITTEKEETEKHSDIKRRPTTFVRPGTFTVDDEDDEDENKKDDADVVEKKVPDKVRITELPEMEKEEHRDLKRRPTTFVRPGMSTVDDEYDDDDDVEIEKKPDKVRIAAETQNEKDDHHDFKRRPTTFVRPGMVTVDEEDDEDGDDQEERKPDKVRIATDAEKETNEHHDFKRRPTTFVRPRAFSIDDEDDDDEDGDDHTEGKKPDKVRIVTETQKETDEHHDIKRRPTTFVRPGTLTLDEEDDDDDEEKVPEKVRIAAAEETDEKERQIRNIKRRPTAFVRPGTQQINNDDDEDEDKGITADDDTPSKVRIVDTEEHVSTLHRRPTAFVRPGTYAVDDDEDDDGYDDDAEPMPLQTLAKKEKEKREDRKERDKSDYKEEAKEKIRPSVLARLFDDYQHESKPGGPTLKDYRPLTELQEQNFLLKVAHLLHSSDKLVFEDDTQMREPSKILRRSVVPDSFENVLNIQHGKNRSRKISTDYINTIDQIERQTENSIRSIEYARRRPTMTVNEYQLKNQRYNEEHKKTEKDLKLQSERGSPKLRGLRLPGDSPLYYDIDADAPQNL